jgi:hypothetical protein
VQNLHVATYGVFPKCTKKFPKKIDFLHVSAQNKRFVEKPKKVPGVLHRLLPYFHTLYKSTAKWFTETPRETLNYAWFCFFNFVRKTDPPLRHRGAIGVSKICDALFFPAAGPRDFSFLSLHRFVKTGPQKKGQTSKLELSRHVKKKRVKCVRCFWKKRGHFCTFFSRELSIFMFPLLPVG